MELTGKIKEINVDFTKNKAVLTLEINEKTAALQVYDKLHLQEKLSFKIEKYREKRSLDANAYMWVLCGKLAEEMSDEKIKYTKEDIYCDAIKEIGVYKDFGGLTVSEAKTLRHAWEMLGIGWITEQVDYMNDGEHVLVRCYYGSSQYNTKQMSRLINNIVQDCEALNIPTKTPDEIANLLSLWECERKLNNG